MRETEQKVKVTYPKATELTKLEKKSLVSNIYVGPPNPNYEKTMGTTPRIQLNDQFATNDDIFRFIQDERGKLDENRKKAFTVSLKVDETVKMGIVSELKQELRKAVALKVNYSAVAKREWNLIRFLLNKQGVAHLSDSFFYALKANHKVLKTL